VLLAKSKGMMIAHIGNLDFAYDIQGRGTPVVFLHAFPLSRRMWQQQVDALCHAFLVITVDFRGFGESQGTDEVYYMELLADDIQRLIRHLSLDSVALCGLSMGGYVALAFYRKYPQMIKALILADTRAESDNKQAQAKRKAAAQLVLRRGSAHVAEEITPELLGNHTLAHKREIVTSVKEIISANEPCAIANAQRGMAERIDSTATLRSIPKPTLLLVGEEDRLTPVECSENMQKHIRNAELVILPKAGHLANLENPEAFNAAVGNFLSTL
jgi:pimeloyl-ACP methyl ester carboxylesterase